MDVSTDKVFIQAVATIKSLTDLSKTTGLPRPSIEDRLNLYGLYNQATKGDIPSLNATKNIGQSPSELKKFNVWLKFKGLTKHQARNQYIRYLLHILNTNYSNVDYPDIAVLKSNLQTSWNILEQSNEISTTMSYPNQALMPVQSQVSGSIPTNLNNNIPRSHSPAASLYRIASSGVNTNMMKPPSRNQSFSKSRKNSFSAPLSGPTIINPNASTLTNSNVMMPSQPQQQYQNNISSSIYGNTMMNSNNNVNPLEFMRWQGEINNTLLQISTELTNLKMQSSMQLPNGIQKDIQDAGHRSISGSTTLSVQSDIDNYKLGFNNNSHMSNDFNEYNLARALKNVQDLKKAGDGRDDDKDNIISRLYLKMIVLIRYLKSKLQIKIQVKSIAGKVIKYVIAVLFFGVFKKVIDIYLKKRYGFTIDMSSSSRGFLLQWKQWLLGMVTRGGSRGALKG